MLFVGVDWAEDHHDVCVMAEDGTVLGKRRVPDSVAGIGELHTLVAEQADENEAVVVGIEIDRGLVVSSLLGGRLRGLRHQPDGVRPATGIAMPPRGPSRIPVTPRCWPIWCAPTDTTTDP